MANLRVRLRRAAVGPKAQRAGAVSGMRRASRAAAPHPPATVKLGNPIAELYDEVSNTQATWVDAVFWLVLGVMGNALGELVWVWIKSL